MSVQLPMYADNVALSTFACCCCTSKLISTSTGPTAANLLHAGTDGRTDRQCVVWYLSFTALMTGKARKILLMEGVCLCHQAGTLGASPRASLAAECNGSHINLCLQ